MPDTAVEEPAEAELTPVDEVTFDLETGKRVRKPKKTRKPSGARTDSTEEPLERAEAVSARAESVATLAMEPADEEAADLDLEQEGEVTFDLETGKRVRKPKKTRKPSGARTDSTEEPLERAEEIGRAHV